MTKRDPRVDPKKGDVLKNGATRTVKEVGRYGKHDVVFCTDTRKQWVEPYIGQWRRWAAKAEVIHVAD